MPVIKSVAKKIQFLLNIPQSAAAAGKTSLVGLVFVFFFITNNSLLKIKRTTPLNTMYLYTSLAEISYCIKFLLKASSKFNHNLGFLYVKKLKIIFARLFLRAVDYKLCLKTRKIFFLTWLTYLCHIYQCDLSLANLRYTDRISFWHHISNLENRIPKYYHIYHQISFVLGWHNLQKGIKINFVLMLKYF